MKFNNRVTRMLRDTRDEFFETIGSLAKTYGADAPSVE